MTSAIKKQVYVVLGMSRSGTSAIARSMQVFDIALGNKLIEADERNPKGFYEDADVLYKINRGLSRAIGRQWLSFHSPECERILASPVVRQFKQLAIELVQNRLMVQANWGFKDPRTDSLLPFWQAVFQAVNVNDHYIIAMRHPLAAAYSSQKFIGIDLEIALLLWLKHMIAVIDGTTGKQRVLISYENMMQSPRQQIQRLHQQLSMPDPLVEDKVSLYVDEFLDRKLNQHQYSDAELDQHPAMKVVPLCRSIYTLLLRVANDEMTMEDAVFFTEWAKIKAEYADIEPVYAYLEASLEKNKEYERQVRGIHKAISWKITLPLRYVEGILRVRRRAIKEKSRLWLTK